MESIVYTVYKTINIEDGKYYIGVHKTLIAEDEYLGSGKILQQAIKKHGRDKFRKEILFVYDNSIEAFQKEKELLENCIDDNLCYNLKSGGYGGWHYVHDNGLTNKNKTRDHYVKMGKLGNKVHLKKLAEDVNYREKWLNAVHHSQTTETIEKIRASLLGRKRNRQWINNGVVNVYHDTLTPMPDGFVIGKKKKN